VKQTVSGSRFLTLKSKWGLVGSKNGNHDFSMKKQGHLCLISARKGFFRDKHNNKTRIPMTALLASMPCTGLNGALRREFCFGTTTDNAGKIIEGATCQSNQNKPIEGATAHHNKQINKPQLTAEYFYFSNIAFEF
jgi:hypothetical protein